MASQVRYFVQAFQAGKRGKIVAGQPLACGSEGTAIRAAERMAPNNVAVWAYSIDGAGDPDAGDYPAPKVLAKYGDLPFDPHEMAA